MVWIGSRTKEWKAKHSARMLFWHQTSKAAQRARNKTSIRNKQQKGKPGHLQTIETRAKIGDSHRGVMRSSRPLKVRQRISKTMKRKIATGEIVIKTHTGIHKQNCLCWSCRKFYQLSYHEEALLQFLKEFPAVVSQRRFGKYRVDAYLPPPYHLAFEADGLEHHKPKRQALDNIRDRYLMSNFNLPVIHIQNQELTPWL